MSNLVKNQRNVDVVRTENLCYTYSDGKEALKDVSIRIKRGERVAVMGANGSGKSTLFLHLNGVLKPKNGTVYICGEPIDYGKKGLLSVRKKVGIVFQDPDNQLFSADVIQEISFGVLNLGFSKDQAKEKVYKVMEELDITEFKDKPIHFLSGGQKKRVAIGDILVMEPDIIILDEPVSALDPKHARMIDGIIDRLSSSGITVILSTHDVERALIWADRVILLDEGRVVAEGNPEEIFEDSQLLQKTNLEKPTVMRIFKTLQEIGFLPTNIKTPKTAGELELLLKSRKEQK